jgi:hypothetical protein
MALRLPLVIVNGQISQLPAGDTLNAPVSAPETLSQTAASTMIAGQVVYNNSADSIEKAKADASGTSKPVGMCQAAITAAASGNIVVNGVLTLTTAQWDALAGTTGGLAAGTVYYLSPTTPGLITSTPPSTIGQFLVELGMAISTTELKVQIRQTIAL